MDAPASGFGANMLRKEDHRLLRGQACFLDDIEIPAGTLHAVYLRSPHAHARILGIDADAARAMPGVVVLTAADFPDLQPLSPDLPIKGFCPVQRPIICTDTVRFVGDLVAIVLADDPYLAEDAAECVLVDYDPLPAIVTLEQALADGAPAVHPAAPDNTLFQNVTATDGFDDAFAGAAHVFRETFSSARVATVSLEPRGCLARHDAGLGETILWSSTQVPHLLRNTLAEALGLRESDLRVIAPDVGGGFGMKASVYPEDILAVAAARLLRRPIKWVGDRQDDFLASSHARDIRFGVEMVMQADGTLVGFRLDMIANAGAYPGIPFGSSIEAGGGPRTFPGPYRFHHYAFRTRAVATNTTPSGPYRGVAAPIAFMALEGMMDRAALALGLDRVEIRRRNLLRDEDYPYVNASGIRYDNGPHLTLLDRALALSDYAGFPARRDDPDRLRGIGIVCITEQTGQGSARYRARGLLRIPGIEGARLKVEPDGSAVLFVSQATQGQGHLTTFAQMAAESLGIPAERISVMEGDTALSPFGSGTFASRGVVAGGGAVITAARVIAQKMKRIAGHLMEADEADIVLHDGRAEVTGVPGLFVTIEDIARTAHAMRPRGMPPGETFGLDTTQHWDQPYSSVSAACHVAEVSIDRRTGQVRVDRYSIVHDCGRMVNPMIVDGQTHGAVLQGLGPVLMERLMHDADGQLLTTTLLDYTLPTMLDVPDMAMDHIETHAIDTLGGVKGVAEGGTIGAVPVLVNAVADAMRGLDIDIRSIPIRPEDLLRAIRAAQPKEHI
ncbi:xanthine dehydrogenase family protein molybdopterin-binding subunit [Humitalea sp. 24SJ18S-53]|uniref:xanthine dehydrogenase family protein molybdopterin-binding subunit n=1 Tax=Humitalea sp. 24SJ18S-53 TaxID=3422307 RepID=UPI003D66AC7D